MADGRGTAAERLQRVLWMIPRACREGGVELDELARELGVEREVVRDDLTEVADRSSYLRAGLGDEIQLHFFTGGVEVWTTGEFRRPPRLGTREAVALELALRCLPPDGGAAEGGASGGGGAAVEGDGAEEQGGADRDSLARRLLSGLASLEADEVEGGGWVVDPGLREMEGAGAPLFRAARRRLPCRIAYLKEGAKAPEERTVEPWALLRAEGHWYAVGRDPEAEGAMAGFEGLRAFRLDRVLEARIREGAEPFEVPAGFEPSAVLDGARIHVPATDERARVRYAPVVAPWIREWVEECWAEEAGEEAGDAMTEEYDGSLVLTHPVSDPRWLVRHVLSLAGAAEVLEPAELREAVREGAERVAEAHGS